MPIGGYLKRRQYVNKVTFGGGGPFFLLEPLPILGSEAVVSSYLYGRFDHYRLVLGEFLEGKR